MTLEYECTLRDFKAWCGGKATLDLLSPNECDQIEEEFLQDRSWTETEVNDFLWFDDDIIAEFLGYDDFEDMWNQRYMKNKK